MDLLLIQRDALASSLTSHVLVAIEAKRSGKDVAIVFTQEALAALVRGTFGWPRELSGQDKRLRIAEWARDAGHKLIGRGEGKQLDAKALVDEAAEAGVRMIACPIWTEILGVASELPSGLDTVETDEFMNEMLGAGRVVGSL